MTSNVSATQLVGGNVLTIQDNKTVSCLKPDRASAVVKLVVRVFGDASEEREKVPERVTVHSRQQSHEQSQC